MKTVVTFGTFDVLHVGHLHLLERAARLGDRLVVGVSTDALNQEKKARSAVYPEHERLELIRALRCVDDAFFEHSLERKADYVRECGASILVMGDDWKGRFDNLSSLCEVVYLPRTPSISTTGVLEKIRG